MEHQVGYPGSDHFAKFYGSVCIGENGGQAATGPTYAGTTDPAWEGDTYVYAFELAPDEPRWVTFEDAEPEAPGQHSGASDTVTGESDEPAEGVASGERKGAGRPRQAHGRESTYPASPMPAP